MREMNSMIFLCILLHLGQCFHSARTWIYFIKTMTYCVEHPIRKMLLMPVDPFEPNKSCYVCSESPLLLEINTRSTKLKDFVEKIVKNKLGMTSPLIMIGSTLIYEIGDDLEEDIAASYARTDKVLVELPAPVTHGTILNVEDLLQELSCNINIKHREEFDEEKEPDGMVLSGWTTQVDKDRKTSPSTVPQVEDDKAVLSKSEEVSRNKRKLSEILESDEAATTKEINLNDDDDDDEDLVILDDPRTSKMRKLR